MRSQQSQRSRANMPEKPQSLALEPFRARYEACFDLCQDLPRLEFSGIQPLWHIFTRIVAIPQESDETIASRRVISGTCSHLALQLVAHQPVARPVSRVDRFSHGVLLEKNRYCRLLVSASSMMYRWRRPKDTSRLLTPPAGGGGAALVGSDSRRAAPGLLGTKM